MSINFKKTIIKLFVLSVNVALTWNRNHFVLHKGNIKNLKST